MPLLAYLNSIVGRLAMEAAGRTSLGEGGLELMKYELDDLPVLDPSVLTAEQRRALGQAYGAVENAARHENKEGLEKAIADLDAAVLGALGADDDVAAAIRKGYEELQHLRRGRVEVEVLVEHPEKKARKPQRGKRIPEVQKKSRSLEEFTE